MAYSACPTSTTGDLWTAANQNTYLRDNMTALAATRTKTVLIPPSGYYNATDGDYYNDGIGVWGTTMTDGKQISAYGYGVVPQDYSSGMTVEGVIYPPVTGDFYGGHYAYLCADGEAYNTHAYSLTNQTVAVTANQSKEMLSLSLAAASVGDHIRLEFRRRGDAVGDTIGNLVFFTGFLVTYTATNYG
jgi:hypothetical protein